VTLAPHGRVKIIARPAGEAPEWVRDAWIGLTLPLACAGVRETLGFGVVTGPRSRLGELWAGLRGRWSPVSGYVIEADLAVELLGFVRPDAAGWWRDNVGAVVASGRTFVFDTAACAVVA